MSKQDHERSPWLFFLLTFAFAWLLWLPAVLGGLGLAIPFDGETYSAVTVPIGAFAPLVAAVVLIFKQQRGTGVKAFLRQALDFRVAPRFYVLALGLPLLIHALAHQLALALGLDVATTLFPTANVPSPLLLAVPYFFVMLLIGGGQEEFGWRGYAQAPLQKKMGLIPASLLIGLVWGVWHLPLWLMPGDGHASYSFIAFVLMTTSISVVYGWLYKASDYKLIIVILFHAMSNTAAPLLPYLHWQGDKPETAYWVYAAVNILFALLIILWMQLRTDRTALAEA